MKRMPFSTLMTVAIFAATAGPGMTQSTDAVTAASAQERQRIDAMSRDTLRELLAEAADAEALAADAAGHAVFRATRGGLIVTGAGGTGVVVDKATGQRTYMRMGSGGIGFGGGIQAYRLVVLFETAAAMQNFIDNGWDAATTAQAAAGKAGFNATSSFVDGIAIYQMTHKGLMAQADFSATRFWKSDKLNAIAGS
jgi:lipid-binding SYLF domain-containing protein